ncbi:MAG: RNA-binding S4 domain-containing protein [Oscillospiraceae bacterium]
MKAIEIKTEYITLSQFLKFSGAVMSGGEVKELIANGEIAVNGARCTQRGAKLHPGDIVSFGGEQYEVIGRCI